VRALAQRSAEAARGVRTLIADSVERVEQGRVALTADVPADCRHVRRTTFVRPDIHRKPDFAEQTSEMPLRP